MPHVPQFCGSEARSVQAPPHITHPASLPFPNGRLPPSAVLSASVVEPPSTDAVDVHTPCSHDEELASLPEHAARRRMDEPHATTAPVTTNGRFKKVKRRELELRMAGARAVIVPTRARNPARNTSAKCERIFWCDFLRVAFRLRLAATARTREPRVDRHFAQFFCTYSRGARASILNDDEAARAERKRCDEIGRAHV